MADGGEEWRAETGRVSRPMASCRTQAKRVPEEKGRKEGGWDELGKYSKGKRGIVRKRKGVPAPFPITLGTDDKERKRSEPRSKKWAK